jgi:hypothetical protein
LTAGSEANSMSVFKDEDEKKRVIFNIEIELAKRLENAKKNARTIGRKLDVDTAVNKALDKFLKKAEKKIYEIMKKQGIKDALVISSEERDDQDEDDDDGPDSYDADDEDA